MAQKNEATPLASAGARHYSMPGTVQPAAMPTAAELRTQSMNIIMNITARRKHEDQFPLFHAIRLENDGTWGLVASAKDYYGEFSACLRIGERVRVEEDDFAFIFAETHPVYLRILYDILEVLDANKYVYYMEKRVELCALKPTGQALDDRTDAVLGAPTLKFTNYVLVFNGPETRRRELARPPVKKSKKYSVFVPPAPRSAHELAMRKLRSQEEDIDSDDFSSAASSADGTPRTEDTHGATSFFAVV